MNYNTITHYTLSLSLSLCLPPSLRVFVWHTTTKIITLIVIVTIVSDFEAVKLFKEYETHGQIRQTHKYMAFITVA